MIRRACDLNLIMISLLASKCQDFKLQSLQFHFIKQLENGHSNFKDLLFWSHDQIQLTSSSYHRNQILKSYGEWQPSLPHFCPPENCHLYTKNEILCTFLHTTVEATQSSLKIEYYLVIVIKIIKLCFIVICTKMRLFSGYFFFFLQSSRYNNR